MPLTARHLLLAFAACVLLYVANFRAQRLTPALAPLAAAAAGSFTEGSGWYPGEPFARAANVRAWGSWNGADDNVGSLTLGPFPAPRILRFGIGGYPGNPGNTLHVELVGTEEKLPVDPGAVGERWRICDFPLPPAWTGRPIRLVAVDAAKGIGGWFALTEPIRGGRGDAHNALLETATGWAINGLLLGLAYVAAARWLARHNALAPHWIPLGAGAIVAACGYLTYWGYFAHPWLGWAVSAATLGASIALLLSRAPRPSALELRPVVGLMLAVGAFHLALLHLFPTAHDFYTLGANRFRDALPGDNMLSHMYAERLFAGEPPKNAADDWQSSDRPPLQVGWQLLTWPVSKMLQLDRRTASGTSAVWFQLLWIAGAYGLLRSFQLTPRRAVAWVAVLGLSGFFLQNTVFTWPKLAAGAFGCGAFAALFLPAPAAAELRRRGLWAAFFAGLGWLAHGGVAFSFLPLAPWVLWRAVRGAWRPWLPAAALLAALVLPWIAYQKFYDPPGNLLLKWHLGGQTKQDARGVWETIREGYARIGARAAWANKVANFHGQVFGDWRQLADVSAATQVERRNHEFFHPGRALTWWPVLAFFAAALTRRPVLTDPRELGLLVGWLAATIVLWCLLMFGAYTASIHHGSYAVMLGLFVLCSVLLERSGRGWLVLLAALQAVTLGTTWAVSNPAIFGPATGLPFVLATAAVLAWLVLRTARDQASPGRALRGHDPRAVAAPAWQRTARPPPAAPSATPLAAAETAGRAQRLVTSFRAWWAQPRLNLWLLAAIAAVLFLRKPHALHTPQLWAEDGSIFLMQHDLHGLGAFALPYAGYLHTLPRLIAAAVGTTTDPAWWPALYNGLSFLIWLAVIARLFSRRFDLPGKPWLALALIAVPHTGEVFFNVTNLQWLTAFVLVQQVLIAPPATRVQRSTDLLILAIVALTGPFGVAFLPLFAVRALLATRTTAPSGARFSPTHAWHHHRDTLFAFAVVFGGAALQAWFMRSGPRFDFQSAPLQLWPNIVVLSRRLLAWPLFGYDVALRLPPALLGGFGLAFFAGLFAWVCRPHPLRHARLTVLAALGLIILAAVYRTRPDTWAADNLDFGDRYFYIPRVLLAWLLIWEFNASPRAVATAARFLCLLVLFVHVRDFTLRAPKNYEWAKHVEPLRRGEPADIPILPEGWTLEYRGRPSSGR